MEISTFIIISFYLFTGNEQWSKRRKREKVTSYHNNRSQTNKNEASTMEGSREKTTKTQITCQSKGTTERFDKTEKMNETDLILMKLVRTF